MDAPTLAVSVGDGAAAHSTIVARARSNALTASKAVGDIAAQLAHSDNAFVLIFISPSYDRAAIISALENLFPDTPIYGCTTAGEIGPGGYDNGSIVALGFSREHFSINARLLDNLPDYSLDMGPEIAADLLAPEGAGEAALWPHSFVLLLCDGLSRQEDAIVASLAPGLGKIPLVGGSAGDGLDFGETYVLFNGKFHQNAAIVAQVRTQCPVHAFRLDNFVPTSRRMVVTGAKPSERLVTEINAEPAAREYARIVGKDPDQLSPFIFAENPVVVRIGDEHFCRSIQKVEDNGDLRFYSAIDEGLVLTVANTQEIVGHLDQVLTEFRNDTEPEVILGFDCVLRRLDVESTQKSIPMSRVLSKHGVLGFNTYGEQFSGMHVNQTLTGAVIYPPDVEGE